MYQARDRSGQRVSGSREADDYRGALEALREEGFFVTSLKPERAARTAAVLPVAVAGGAVPVLAPPLPGTGQPGVATVAPPVVRDGQSEPAVPGVAPVPIGQRPWLHANSQQLALYFRQMEAMLNAGTGLSQALATMGQYAPARALQAASAEQSKRTAAGIPWSETMKTYPGLFSELMIGMIQAGEAGGFLDRMCGRLADYGERDYKIQQTVKSETWYPKLLMVCAIVIPSTPVMIVPMFTGQSVLAGFLSFLRQILMPFVVIAFVWALNTLAKRAAPLARGSNLRYVMDSIKMSVPVAGKVVRGLATAKFCRALGALSSAGVGLHKTIGLASNACGNAKLARGVMGIMPRLEQGIPLYRALEETRVFPGVALQMVKTGEESGNLEPQLEKVAEFLEQDAETAIKQGLQVLGVLVLIMIGISIGIQVIHFWTGYFDQMFNAVNG